ncbi:uncharacterized protein [Centruroides vittatus]|uniref:uncharacterized protein n=1 Tax=Centruroides vittatus TaxID=120091 RepID=UPI00350EA420
MPARTYKKLVLALTKARAKLNFLLECKKNDVYPMSIYRIRLPLGCGSLTPKLRWLCLRKAIRTSKRCVYSCLNRLIETEDDLFEHHRDYLQLENRKVTVFQEILARNLARRYKKKLQWIMSKQKPIKKNVPPTPLVCWDDIVPPHYVIETVAHGPMYTPGSDKPLLETVMPDIERMVCGMDEVSKEHYRWKAAMRISGNRRCRKGNIWMHIRKTKKWLAEERIILLRADKNRALVLLKEETYKTMLRQYIVDTNSEQVADNYVDRLHARVVRFTCTPLAKAQGLGRAVVASPDTPRLFAFAKTHKPTPALRPILDKARAPTRLLETELHRILARHLQDYPLTVKNSRELVDALKRTQVTESAHVTVLDFQALYPSIKIEPCFCALRDVLLAKYSLPAHRKHVLELAHLVCYNSLFGFDNATYLQKRGVPMGSPISGDLCELILRQLERDVIPRFTHDIILYRRYVDDVMIIWKNGPNVHDFLRSVNDNPYGLTLKLDQISSTDVHFLDVTIQLRGNNIETRVYYKPDYIPMYIPAGSEDPYPYKIAAFRALVRRAYTHNSKREDTLTELAHIEDIAASHGYRRGLVRKLARNLRNTNAAHHAARARDRSKSGPNQRTVVQYNRGMHDIYKEIARKKGTDLTFSRTQSIYSLLRNAKDKPDFLRAPGVYSIPVRDHRSQTDLIYIGSTKRSVKKRIAEHRYDVNKKRHTTALSTYATDPDIKADFDKTSLIKTSFDTDRIRALETLEIYKASKSGKCINFKDGNVLSYAWRYVSEVHPQW